MAHSTPARGQISAQTQATIGISVSILPRFHLSDSHDGALQMTSNVPALRYGLRAETPAGAFAGNQFEVPSSQLPHSGQHARPADGPPVLVIVVPD